MLRLLTLNINGYSDTHGSWEQRRPLISRLAAEADAHIVALQAVQQDERRDAGVDQATQLNRDLMYPHVVYFSATNVKAGTVEGSALLSRLPLRDSILRTLPHTSDDEDKVIRHLLHANVLVGLRQVALFNCHLSWVEAQQVRDVAHAVSYLGSSGARILVGDLNARPESAALAALSECGLVDSWHALGKPEGSGATFEAHDPTIRIDYCLVSGELHAALRDAMVLHHEEGSARQSDHRALLVELDLNV